MKIYKKVLILGATGMLGHKLCQGFAEKEHFQVSATTRSPLNSELTKCFPKNITFIPNCNAMHPESIFSVIQSTSPDFVINCIGIVKQSPESKNYSTSIAINSLFPHILAQKCAENNVKLIHISTDCVFSGTFGHPYIETMNSDAEDLYGKSKFLGEVIDQKNALTIRTSIIGREITHPTGLLEWFLSQKGKNIKGFSRALFSGLTTNLAVNVLEHVIMKTPELSGLYHVSTAGISKFDLLQIINEVYRTNIHIQKDEDFCCDRRLNGERFEKATGWKAPSWNDLVKEMHQQDLLYYKV